jgi:spore germination cell wall hydrolase CwlJ-like protein
MEVGNTGATNGHKVTVRHIGPNKKEQYITIATMKLQKGKDDGMSHRATRNEKKCLAVSHNTATEGPN